MILKVLNHTNEIEKNFGQENQYIFYQVKKMNGSGLLMFSKRKWLDHIKDLLICKVGSKINMNQGAQALKFKIDETQFAVISCHLQSDQPALKRAEALNQLIEENFFQVKNFAKIDQHIVAVVMGNINFTLELADPHVREAIFKNNLALLHNFDQLN